MNNIMELYVDDKYYCMRRVGESYLDEDEWISFQETLMAISLGYTDK